MAEFVQQIPEPVLGGNACYVWYYRCIWGVRIVSKEALNRRAIMILAISLAVGLGVSQQPQILQFCTRLAKNITVIRYCRRRSNRYYFKRDFSTRKKIIINKLPNNKALFFTIKNSALFVGLFIKSIVL